MKPPTTKRGVQKLTGRLALLNIFISRSAEKCFPFFKALKGSGNFQWGEGQDKAFKALKAYIENLAIMASPSEGPELLLYIAISGATVSAALVEERSIEGALKRVEVTVLRNGKDSICRRDGSKKASALLLELKDQSFDLFPSSGYVRKLGGL